MNSRDMFETKTLLVSYTNQSRYLKKNYNIYIHCISKEKHVLGLARKMTMKWENRADPDNDEYGANDSLCEKVVPRHPHLPSTPTAGEVQSIAHEYKVQYNAE